MEEELALINAVEKAGHAVMLTDREGTIEYVNPAFEEITGYTAEETIGRTPELLNSGVHEKAFFDDLWSTILAGQVYEGEMVNSCKDGSLIYVDNTVTPVFDGDESVQKFVAMFRDITEKNLERQQLQVLHRVLRHDTRNQLNVITGYAESIIEETENEQITERAQAIANSGRQLTEISTTAKTIGSTVQNVAEAKCVDLDTAVPQLIETVNGAYPDSKITLRAAKSTDHVKLPVLLALEELLENAIIHNDRAEPAVTVAVDTCDVKGADLSEPDSWLAIDVRDDGPGIPNQEQATLKEGDETPLQHSSGLGLWMVHWIVHHVGGRVDIEANTPRGTIVSLLVPGCSGELCTSGSREQRPHPD